MIGTEKNRSQRPTSESDGRAIKNRRSMYSRNEHCELNIVNQNLGSSVMTQFYVAATKLRTETQHCGTEYGSQTLTTDFTERLINITRKSKFTGDSRKLNDYSLQCLKWTSNR